MLQGIAGNQFAETNSGLQTRRTITESLTEQAMVLRARLQDVEAALEALQKNPEVESIINLVSKVHNGY